MTHPVNGILPEDLLMEIISKIPARFLVRLRCVCRSWNALITDNLVSELFNRSNNARKLFLFHGSVLSSAGKYVASFRLYEQPSMPYDTNPIAGPKLDPFKNLYFPDRFINCVVAGSINGIICLFCVTRSQNRFAVLWNPAINYWKLICLPLHKDEDDGYASIGLAFDSLTNDYKIIRLVSEYKIIRLVRSVNIISYIEVYSAKQDSWSVVNSQIPFLTTRPNCSLIVKGVPYWSRNYIHGYEDFQTGFIASVDPHTGSYKMIPYPQIALNKDNSVDPFNLMDSLALLIYLPGDQTFHVYALDDENSCATTWINIYSTPTPIVLKNKDIGICRCFEDALLARL
ncbi:putative F-box protein At3g21120 [Apium graveolens]|uniref:putative F-box protein At3g21120 n=1 Tax=Apium graveolens TaxID=4045 RepID=UPI003D7B0A5B